LRSGGFSANTARMISRSLSFLSLAALSLAACGDDSTTPPPDGGPGDAMVLDGGPGTDSGPPAVPVCMATRAVTSEVGVTMTVTGDTSMAATRPVDLGPGCGNAESPRFAPQEVIEYTVPGTGPLGVELTLVTTGTDMMFDTVIQLRTSCDAIPTEPNTCFDDTDLAGGELRSTGGFSAMGGDVVYIFITGYSETPVEGFEDRGAWALDITARANTAPEILGAEILLVGDEIRVTAMGADPDGDVLGFNVNFLDAAGDPVDLAAAPLFAEDLTGMTTFTGTAMLTGGNTVRMAGATQAAVSIYDRVFATSAPTTVPVVDAALVGIGETCDATNICAAPLTCESSVCEAPADVVTACGAATDVTVATPTTTLTTASITGSIDMGTGLFAGRCAATPGLEALYTVDVPAGMFDLVANTDRPGTAMDTDTVVWIRSECADPTDEVACSDDIGMMMLHSNAVVMNAEAGTYTIGVEIFGGATAATAFELEVGLRPVLATGATCDDAGVMNRCAGGACATGTCP
jgi:hypothetical protein